MKIILAGSQITIQKLMPPGTEVEFFPDFVNSDHPVSEGWIIRTVGVELQNTLPGVAGVSDVIPVFGYSKIKVTGAYGNGYLAVAAFFADSEATTGISPLYMTGGQQVLEDGEVDIPAGATYVRFAISVNSRGSVAPNTRYFMVV